MSGLPFSKVMALNQVEQTILPVIGILDISATAAGKVSNFLFLISPPYPADFKELSGKKMPREVQSILDAPSSGRVGSKHTEVTSRLCFVFVSLKTGIKRDTKLFTNITTRGLFVKLVDKNVALCDIIKISAPVRSSS